MDFISFNGFIDRMKKQQNRKNRARRHAVKKGALNVMPKVEDVKEFRKSILKYLWSTLQENVEQLDQETFRLVAMNLLFHLVLRNVSRSGTISAIMTEYVEDERLI